MRAIERHACQRVSETLPEGYCRSHHLTKSAASSPITGGAGTVQPRRSRARMPVFERQRTFHGRGSRDGWRVLHARNMASGQEVSITQTTKPLRRPQDGSRCVSRSGQENPIQTRPARVSPLLCAYTRRTPMPTIGSERISGVRSAWRLWHAGHAGEVSAVGTKRGVQGRHSRRAISDCSVRSHALAALSGG
jgi:hypothetical protein